MLEQLYYHVQDWVLQDPMMAAAQVAVRGRRRALSPGAGVDSWRRTAEAALDVPELVAQSADAPVGQCVGQVLHEGMVHPGAGPMAQHQKEPAVRRAQGDGRDFAPSG